MPLTAHNTCGFRIIIPDAGSLTDAGFYHFGGYQSLYSNDSLERSNTGNPDMDSAGQQGCTFTTLIDLFTSLLHGAAALHKNGNHAG